MIGTSELDGLPILPVHALIYNVCTRGICNAVVDRIIFSRSMAGWKGGSARKSMRKAKIPVLFIERQIEKHVNALIRENLQMEQVIEVASSQTD